MKVHVQNYTFDKTAKTVTFTDYTTIRLDSVLLVVNVTAGNIIIYNFADPGFGGTVATNVLSLAYDTSAMANTDKLLVYYDDNTFDTWHKEDVAFADADAGTMTLAVRKNTAASTSGSDGDYQPLITNTTGHLWVDASGQTLTVGTHAVTQSGTWNIGTVTTVTGITNVVHIDDNSGNISIDDGGNSITVDGTVAFSNTTIAVTNAGTFAVQDSQVVTEDVASVGAEKMFLAGAVRRDTAASSSGTDGDYSTINTDSTGRLWVHVGTVDAGTITTITNVVHVDDNSGSLTVDNAGTFAVQASQAGTWTVQPGNTANTTPWLFSIHDGTNKASVRSLANNALNVAITDASGNQVTSFGGGTQYTEDVTNGSTAFVGTMFMFEDYNNVPSTIEHTNPLPVEPSRSSLYDMIQSLDAIRLTLIELRDLAYNNTPKVTQTIAWPASADASITPALSSSAAYESSRVVKNSGGVIYGILGYNSKVSSQFVQIFNSSTIPADGSAPLFVFTVAATSNFYLDLGDRGKYLSQGISVANSSTGPTKTIGSADCWFNVSYL